MTGWAATPPACRYRFDTTDLDTAREAVRAGYADPRPRLLAASAPFRVTGTVTDLGGATISDCDWDGSTTVQSPPHGDLTITHLLRGRYRVANHHDGIDPAVGESLSIPPHLTCTITTERFRGLVVTLRADRLAALAAELVAQDPDVRPAPLRFEGFRPASPALARHWQATVADVAHRILQDDQLMASPLVRAQIIRQLAATALAVFPNTALAALTDPHPPGPGPVDTAVLRRALAFIDTHADQPIGVADIARAARIGVRGLQHAFHRYRDTTPLRHLRTVRMERAHRDLEDGDPTRGDTVVGIAARWGFSHAGRFSLAYQHRYGLPPSHTLRR